MTIATTIDRLRHLCNSLPTLLLQGPASAFSQRPSPGKWSRQEMLGHLLDSAVNNHQRFIRVQYEELPFIKYNQDQWVNLSHYNDMDRESLVELWKRYNLHLAEIISRIPEDKLGRFCNTGGENPVSLEFLIHDYVAHMEHHLKEIIHF